MFQFKETSSYDKCSSFKGEFHRKVPNVIRDPLREETKAGLEKEHELIRIQNQCIRRKISQ